MADDVVDRLLRDHPVNAAQLCGCVKCEAAEEIEWLRKIATQLAEALEGMSCQNCEDRKCMDCVFRSQHDACVDDCPDCVRQERIHSPYTDRYEERAAALRAWDDISH